MDKQKDQNEYEITCMCDCHRDNCHIMHWEACCIHSQEKYIHNDGIIDMIRLEEVRKQQLQ